MILSRSVVSTWCCDFIRWLREDNSTCIVPPKEGSILSAPGWGGAYNGQLGVKCSIANDLEAAPDVCNPENRHQGDAPGWSDAHMCVNTIYDISACLCDTLALIRVLFRPKTSILLPRQSLPLLWPRQCITPSTWPVFMQPHLLFSIIYVTANPYTEGHNPLYNGPKTGPRLL